MGVVPRPDTNMTHFDSQTVQNMPPLRVALDALMHRHGTISVLGATVVALFRAATLRRDLGGLSDHMRQDIGLPPRAEPPSIRELMR